MYALKTQILMQLINVNRAGIDVCVFRNWQRTHSIRWKSRIPESLQSGTVIVLTF